MLMILLLLKYSGMFKIEIDHHSPIARSGAEWKNCFEFSKRIDKTAMITPLISQNDSTKKKPKIYSLMLIYCSKYFEYKNVLFIRIIVHFG